MPTERPKISVPTDKREQILNGAMQVFLTHGYAGTSMDRVAATAGVSKQTIYSHFQDKQGLFTALIDRVTRDRFQIVFGALPLTGEPERVLRKIADTLLHSIAEDTEYIAFIRLVIGESGRFPELARQFVGTIPKRAIATLSKYFENHRELNCPDPEATTRIFLGSLVSFVLMQNVLEGEAVMPMDGDRLVERLITLVLQSS
ncbi:TetR/AcrR family transcriptional regulator [Oxynema sp. CENA135]|uniref:TetR/AcrR family transcriptional regulator n=1 Tax=Oxynema sp. CENA135 TaxID=984206 RepID=UPI00190DBEC6|nr:TetR/AcrR family transcriptional regulator [Oxynema sp. CENA135]MBK4729698.1 TetR/AcrR family transcriptional regulator [Oxynema sp. CENA135]